MPIILLLLALKAYGGEVSKCECFDSPKDKALKICVYSYPSCVAVSIKIEKKDIDEDIVSVEDYEDIKRRHQSRWNFAKAHVGENGWGKEEPKYKFFDFFKKETKKIDDLKKETEETLEDEEFYDE